MIAKTIGPVDAELLPANRVRARVPYEFSLDPRSPGFQREWAASKRARAELNYNAATDSRYRHAVTGLGGTADAHYAHGLSLWKIRELAREFDRNDPNVGQLVDRGLDNILGAGLRVDPQTADPAVNNLLRELWEAWADDPAACDYGARFTFDELERLALRHTWIDGDAFAILDEFTGTVRFEEGDRVVSWDTAGDDVVHGVVLRPDGRGVRGYLFQRLRPGERKVHTTGISVGDLVEIPADMVIHVFFPKRATQTRGISAFAPVFDQISLASDIEHARLVKLQVSSCIAGFLTSEYPSAFYLGGTDTQTSSYDDATDLEFGEFSPGMIGKLRGGQKFEGFSPDVVSNEESEFTEGAIRRVGLTIGLPLELSMLTSKNNSYSALRGVVEQYKIGARVVQKRFKTSFRSRVYRWKVAQFVEQGLAPARPDIMKHAVLTPAWPYINPVEDAQADAVRLERGLASPRQVWAERGRDYDQGVVEIATDRAALVKALQAEAAKLGVDWRDLLAVAAQPKPAREAA